MKRLFTLLLICIAPVLAKANGETISPNMGLVVPTVGITTGPDWASDIDTSLGIIDRHDHSLGNGVQITPDGLNINSDLSCQNNNLTNPRSVRFSPQTSPISGADDLGALFESGVDLYYRDGNGNTIRLTQSGSIVGTSGSITGLVAPASASYSPGSSTFIWQSNTNTSANMDAACLLQRNITAGSNAITLCAPGALAANYNLTWPGALPASQKFMTLDASGNIAAPWVVDNSSVAIVSNSVAVKDLGITSAKIANLTIDNSKIVDRTIIQSKIALLAVDAAVIANSTITGTQVASDINLPGTSIQIQGLKVVASAPGASTNLMITRGSINNVGTITAGEGFSVTSLGTGNYRINYNATYADLPAVTAIAGPVNSNCDIQLTLSTTSAATFLTHSPIGSGTNANCAINFIAIGQRP